MTPTRTGATYLVPRKPMGKCWRCLLTFKVRDDGRIRRHRMDQKLNRGMYCQGGNCYPVREAE